MQIKINVSPSREGKQNGFTKPGKMFFFPPNTQSTLLVLAITCCKHTHTNTGIFQEGLVSCKHAVEMIFMLEIMTTLVMETYHSRYMALLKEGGWKEIERRQKQDLC